MKIPYEGQTEYTIDLDGYTAHLPVVQVSPDLHIASFVILGAVEMTQHCARKLAQKINPKKFDYIICPEAKVLPLAQALCNELGVSEYVVLRKGIKGYMIDPVEVKVKSITTDSLQKLVIDGADAEKIRGKRVFLLDDVVSTGGTFYAMEELLHNLDTEIVGYGAILREGDSFPPEDLIYLKDLPVFPG